MSIVKFLISEFSDQENIPVEVDDVLARMREFGVEDEIYFFDADIQTDVLKGEIEHWEYPQSPTGPMRRVANIYTAKTLHPHEKRLIECKEMLHVLDPVGSRVDTLSKTDALIDKIRLPPELVDFANEGIQANTDRGAVAYALAILFPYAVREQFLPFFKAGKISLAEIANHVALPEVYVAFVMSDYWASHHDAMVRRTRNSMPDRVSTLAPDGSTLEVHSVGIGANVYSYAKTLIEKGGRHGRVITECVIERSGMRRTLSAQQILDRAANMRS